jgi:hypothetical protein
VFLSWSPHRTRCVYRRAMASQASPRATPHVFSRLAPCPVCSKDVHKILLASHVELCLQKANGTYSSSQPNNNNNDDDGDEKDGDAVGRGVNLLVGGGGGGSGGGGGGGVENVLHHVAAMTPDAGAPRFSTPAPATAGRPESRLRPSVPGISASGFSTAGNLFANFLAKVGLCTLTPPDP